MLVYGYGIILGYTDGELLGSTLGAADINTIGIDEESNLGSPDGDGIIIFSTHFPHSGKTCHAYE